MNGMAVVSIAGESKAPHFGLAKFTALVDCWDAHESVDQVICRDLTFLVVQEAVNMWTA